MTTDGRRRTTRTVWAQSPSTRPESATILSALSAATFAFDSAGDGITSQDGQHIAFASSTTGDIDGIDLTLDRADGGRLIFESAVGCCGLLWAVVGCCEVALAELRLGQSDRDRQRIFDFGGLEMQASVERYPETVKEYRLELVQIIQLPAGERTPYFVKALQTDGHAAWSSPIYVSRR